MATEDPATSSAPTPEQRDLAALLREVIGHVFADRFLDFCRLSNSAGKTDLALRATLPLAAHAMRELESILRQYLRTPFGANTEPDTQALEKRQQTEAALLLLAYDSNKIRNALRELEVPKHADEIKGICGKLGIAQDGEVAKAWLNLVNTQAELTHRRSAHELPVVGEAFRRDFARPFQMFVGEVALALQRHYSAYIREVDKLVVATDHVKSVNDFRKNIPGTPPLQKRFYEKIAGAGWLLPLRAKGLLRAPVPNLDDKEAGVIRWIEWPPALYLVRMARSDDASARAQVAVVLRELQDAEEFGLRDKCFEVATALPAAEAAELTDVAVEWLKPRWYWTLKAPEEYLKHLIKGEERAAVLRVAHALFGISRNEAGVVSRYDRFDYEHSTPPFVEPITALCGLDALGLYCDLLMEAALAKELIHDDPPRDFSSSSDAFAHESKAQHDIFASVAWATRRCAEQLLKKDPANIGPIVDALVARKYRIFLQLALKLAATAPQQLGGRARQLLMRPDLLGQSWCAKDYGDLAQVSFGGLDQQDQDAILREIDAMPDRDGPIWARNFEAMRGHPATEEEMARIKLLFRRDIFWHWRDVLPADRRADIDKIVAEYGKPYGEDDPRFSWEGQRDESPVSAADIVAKPIAELVAFLKGWKPGEGEEQLTASALGMELRNAVEFEPQRFAASAEVFEDVGPYYLLRILEGLDSQAKNHKPFDWAPVLALLAKVIARAKAASPAVTAGSRDEPSWSWVLLTATSLIRDGFIEGSGKIPISHADEVWHLLEALWSAPPIVPDDFASRLEQDAFFAAQATLRGSVLEAAIWFGNWSDPQKGEVQPAQVRELPARVRAILDQTLALQDESDSGTPAIIGRYFDWLLILDRAWVEANEGAMLGASASGQRKELIWEGHLLHGRSTLLTWDFFESFANEEIERIDQPGYNNDWRGKQLTQLLFYFYYWGMIGLEPGGPLMRFLSRADARLREHGVWSMMHDLNRADLPQDKRERLHAYYESRIAAAASSGDREVYRRELGMLGIWFGKNKAENGWMLQQLYKLASLKLTPPHPADFFTWLDSLMPEQTDEVIASLAYVVEDDGFERWMFAASNQLVRKILTTGMASPDPETVKRAKQIANVLVAKGQSDLFDLTQ